MKKNTFIAFFTSVLVFSCLLFSCKQATGSTTREEPVSIVTDDNPKPYDTRTDNLNFIFGNEELSKTTIQISRSEWNTLCGYYDQNKRNETYVHANYFFDKGNYSWTLLDCGFRLRGNTSRLRPQDKNSKKYQQAHFKVDFEEFLVATEAEPEPERKMSGCMKGVILKRFKDDPTYVREVYGYDLFRRNGI